MPIMFSLANGAGSSWGTKSRAQRSDAAHGRVSNRMRGMGRRYSNSLATSYQNIGVMPVKSL